MTLNSSHWHCPTWAEMDLACLFYYKMWNRQDNRMTVAMICKINTHYWIKQQNFCSLFSLLWIQVFPHSMSDKKLTICSLSIPAYKKKKMGCALLRTLKVQKSCKKKHFNGNILKSLYYLGNIVGFQKSKIQKFQNLTPQSCCKTWPQLN